MMKMVWVLCPLLLMVPMLCAGTSHMLQHVQRIVFFGDSLTDGADWPDWAVNTLRAETPARHLELYNAGVGGNTYHDLRVRLATDVLALHPDLVVLHSGTNDIFQKVTDAAYRADLEAILHTLRDRHIRVLLLTTPPVKDPVVCARQHELNAIVCEVAAHFKCPVADAHDAFDKAIAAGVEPLGPDGVHHTAAGWRLMGQTVLLALGGKLPLQETVAPNPGQLPGWFVSPTVKREEHPTPPAAYLTAFDPRAAGWAPYHAADIRKTCVWWRVGSVDRGAIYPVGDLQTMHDTAAYAGSTLTVPHACRMTMRVGGPNPLLVWLNGKQVWCGAGWHGWHADTDRFTVTLQPGENHLLVYCASLFYLELTKADG